MVRSGAGAAALETGPGVLRWLLAICGRGAHWTRATPWRGIDGQLAALACLLGVRSIVLAAQPNDNGLPHTELVDYDWPLGWPALPRNGSALNAPASCLPPYGAHRALAEPGAIAAHWRRTRKLALRAPALGVADERLRGLGGSDAAPSLPCDFSFGEPIADYTSLAWRARCQLPSPAAPSWARSDCYLACRGAMSEAFSRVNLTATFYDGDGRAGGKRVG